MNKTDFEIKVVKMTNDLIQEKLTRNINEMKGWCVPFSTHLEQAVIDAKHTANRKLSLGDDNDLWTAVIIELNLVENFKDLSNLKRYNCDIEGDQDVDECFNISVIPNKNGEFVKWLDIELILKNIK